MKFINNKLYINYSELSPEQKSIYRMRIKIFLKKLVYEYNNFEEWFSQLFISDILLKNDREIIICECDYQLAGVAILKNDDIEKKICTLRVAKRFQKQGIGQHLMELSFEWLNDDKPLITIVLSYASFEILAILICFSPSYINFSYISSEIIIRSYFFANSAISINSSLV